ncbi:MAG: VWA domain-containing protein, partial [Gammaproteobacteria bacterium]
VVDGQPVLTFWGYGSLPPEPVIPAPPAPEIPAPASAGGVGPARAPRWLPRLLLLVLIIAALSALSWLAMHFWPWRWPPWGPDYGALIATERAEETRLRDRLLALNADLAQALGHCALRARLDALREEEAALSERLSGMQTKLAEAIAACRDRDALAGARAEQDGLRQRIAELHTRLADQIKVCAEKAAAKPTDSPRKPKPPEGKPPTKTEDTSPQAASKDEPAAGPKKPDSKKDASDGKPQAKAEGLPPCPGERAPEEAPDVAIVLDSSGSMRLPERMTPGQQAQYAACMQGSANPLFALIQHMTCYGLFQGLGGPTRLQAAQRSMQNVVRSLPGDVDIGLAVLEDCPKASDYGFFSGSERDRLLGQVNRLAPRQGTPLAHGVALGGKMIEGVRAPGIMVVVSDGQDSCRQDPCAVARQLKSGKPRLKINVVDITGEGHANCLAGLTGGRVLTSASGMPMDQMIREAASEAEKPAHCK